MTEKKNPFWKKRVSLTGTMMKNMIYWNSPFPHNECDRTYPTISPVKLLQLSVHVLLPPQRFEVDEAAILFLSFSVMEEKKILINLIHSDTTRFKTKRPTHRTQFSFG